MDILLSALGGGAGGNLLALLMKNRTLGPMWNTIIGAVGGIAGGYMMGSSAAGQIGGGAIGGIVLTLIGSLLKKRRASKA